MPISHVAYSSARGCRGCGPGWGCPGLSGASCPGRGPTSRPGTRFLPGLGSGGGPGPWVWEGHECSGLFPPCAAGKGVPHKCLTPGPPTSLQRHLCLCRCLPSPGRCAEAQGLRARTLGLGASVPGDGRAGTATSGLAGDCGRMGGLKAPRLEGRQHPGLSRLPGGACGQTQLEGAGCLGRPGASGRTSGSSRGQGELFRCSSLAPS